MTPDLSYYREGVREYCEDSIKDEDCKIKKGLVLALAGPPTDSAGGMGLGVFYMR